MLYPRHIHSENFTSLPSVSIINSISLRLTYSFKLGYRGRCNERSVVVRTTACSIHEVNCSFRRLSILVSSNLHCDLRHLHRNILKASKMRSFHQTELPNIPSFHVDGYSEIPWAHRALLGRLLSYTHGMTPSPITIASSTPSWSACRTC